MIRVRALANNLTSLVNPNISAVLKVNAGYTVDTDGNQVPAFDEENITIQAQSLASDELDQLKLIDKQGEYLTVYAFGSINSVQRWLNRGASQLEFAPYGEQDVVVWGVDKVLESYSTWVRLLLVRVT